MNDFEKLKQNIELAKSELFDPIYQLLEEVEADANKYYVSGVKSAGNRLKKKMQDIRKALNPTEAKKKVTAIKDSARALRQSIIDSSKVEA